MTDESLPESPIPPSCRGGATRRVTYPECNECGDELETFAEAGKGVCSDCQDNEEGDQ
jgi:hypothetical protein